jgi:hypothetical protein
VRSSNRAFYFHESKTEPRHNLQEGKTIRNMMDQDKLKSVLKAIADKHWKENRKAMLLSDVAPELAKEAGEVDYRTLLEGKSLKAFIKDTGDANGYRLVEHPTQGAKVALAPLDSDFEFTAAVVEKSQKKSSTTRKRDNKAGELLEIWATLPEEDLAEIYVPISALVKLLNK